MKKQGQESLSHLYNVAQLVSSRVRIWRQATRQPEWRLRSKLLHHTAAEGYYET